MVSGKTAERVASMAGVLADWMEGDGAGVGLAEVAHTLNHHRARHGEVRHGGRAGSRRRRWPGCGRWPRGYRRRGWWVRMRASCRSGTVFVYSGSGFAVGGDGPAVAGR